MKPTTVNAGAFSATDRFEAVMSVGASLTLVTSIWKLLLKVAPAASVTRMPT
ncbi:hypothetical protein ACVWZV_000991 [Bradyrhizobium sp. GM5.1]